MMATKKVDDAKVLADQIAAWADLNGHVDDPYVVGLVNGLYKKRDLSMWASLDPLQMLPYAQSRRGESQLKYGRIFAIIRNILVFAPVAITWKGVEQASVAFSKFIENNNASTVNFLEFWQNGYGVLPDFWTISNIARLDYSLVGVIILLSVVSIYLTERAKSLRASDRVVLDGDRTHLAIQITSYLFDKRAINNVTMNEGLATALQNLQNTTKSLEVSIGRLENASKKHPSDISFRGEYKDFFNRLNKVLNKKESK